MKDIVYANNNVLGYFEKETYLQYSKAEKEKLFKEIENKVKKADSNRKKVSLISGVCILILFIIFSIFTFTNKINLGQSKLINITFIAALAILLWVFIYYILGLFLYKKIHIIYW